MLFVFVSVHEMARLKGSLHAHTIPIMNRSITTPYLDSITDHVNICFPVFTEFNLLIRHKVSYDHGVGSQFIFFFLRIDNHHAVIHNLFDLAQAKTLYHAKLDEPILQEIQEKYPHLLNKP